MRRNEPAEPESIREALRFVSPDDHETWWKMGMAVKSALGESGRAIWEEWSRQSKSYNPKAAAIRWKSFRAAGGIGIGTLFAEAKRNGWTPVRRELSPQERRELAERRRKQAERMEREKAREALRKEKAQDEAAALALEMMAQADLETHPYLAAKGFPDRKVLVREGKILIPMLDYLHCNPLEDRKVRGLQMIGEDGSKEFLPGQRVSGCVQFLGSGSRRPQELWFCEGFATGLSVQRALESILRHDDRIVICFNASNMARIASTAKRGFVVSDHDDWKSDRQRYLAGQKAAWESGRPFWIPPESGDANDYEAAHHFRALADSLREFLLDQWSGAKRTKPEYERAVP